MLKARIDEDVVKLDYLDGRYAYRWIGEQAVLAGKVSVPRDGHAQECDEWREFEYTGKLDYLGYKVYNQIP